MNPAAALVGDAVAYPREPWVLCAPMAGVWFACYYFTNGDGVTAVGCGCKPCAGDSLFCKSCRSLKALRQGKRPKHLRIAGPEEFDYGGEEPPRNLLKYAKWVEKNVIW